MLLAHELTQINLPDEYLPLNISAARFNIEKAAYLGFAKAQTKMGAAYELCQLGCDFDPSLSLHYNALASKQGESEAEMAISKWFLCGYEGLFEKNEESAFSFAQRAAQSGLATAEFALGYFFEIGIYVPVNLKESRIWYEKAADHGNKDAVARIDGISRSKTLSRKDHENVAVAKIQSQYGSHRGKRPDRFKNPPTPMPTITDNTIDMPEPKIPTPRPGENRAHAYSATTKGSQNSPAPYPLDDSRGRPSPRPMGRSTYSNPNIRMNPDVRPPSVAHSEQSYPDANYRGSGYPTFQPTRPNSGAQNMGLGRGRGALAHGVPGAQGIQGYQQQNSGYATPRPPGSPTPTPRPQSAQPPPIDIGFSAPPDPSGADRKKRQQRSDNPNMPPPGTPPRVSSYEAPAGRNPNRMSSLPHAQTMPANSRTSSPQTRPMSSGRQGVTLQDGPQRPGIDANLTNITNIPPKVPNPDRPAATPPPSVPAARPPGKGPKTFQEMGVPPSKNESDCVSPLQLGPFSVRTDYCVGRNVIS